MNEAIKIGAEWIKDSRPEKEMDYDGLKMGINNLLHTHLPGKTTLNETELIAMVMWSIITDSETFIKNVYDKSQHNQ